MIMSLAPRINVEVNGGSELTRDRSFFGITATQFLGAFNDNFYKQLMLLLAIPVVPGALDQQQVATIVFALPFVLFSGIAGHFFGPSKYGILAELFRDKELGLRIGFGQSQSQKSKCSFSIPNNSRRGFQLESKRLQIGGSVRHRPSFVVLQQTRLIVIWFSKRNWLYSEHFERKAIQWLMVPLAMRMQWLTLDLKRGSASRIVSS
jgi:hypothetical protein